MGHLIPKLFLWLTMMFLLGHSPIYAQDSLFIDIQINGLEKTRAWVVLMELPFQEGEKVARTEVEDLKQKARQNLYNLALFNDVQISSSQQEDSLHLFIQVAERWYLWGSPRIGIEERNSYDLLGALQGRRLNRLVIGGTVQWQNLTGRNELLYITGQLGFSQRIRVDFRRPYLIRPWRIDLGAGVRHIREREIILGTGDGQAIWRRVEDEPLRKTWLSYVFLQKRFTPRRSLRMELSWQHHDYVDSLFSRQASNYIRPFFLTERTSLRYTSVLLGYVQDERDVKRYPLAGYKAMAWLRYVGNLERSDIHFGRLYLSMAKYHPINRRWNLSAGGIFLHSIGQKIPWQEKTFLWIPKREFPDYSQELRGYQPYAIAGTQLGILKTEVKFGIFPYQTVSFPFIPFKKLSEGPLGCYLTAFFDQGFIRDQTQVAVDPVFLDQWLYGYGVGLNLIGFYDMLLRVEYSRNHLNQGGIYLHTTVQIK
ncbi:MAG: BamA/TamA family outer membrane protein [Bacteroidota bacterium]